MSILNYFKPTNTGQNLKRPHDQAYPPDSTQSTPTAPAPPSPGKKVKLTPQVLHQLPSSSSVPNRPVIPCGPKSNSTESLTEKLSSDDEPTSAAPQNRKKAGRPHQQTKTAAPTQKPNAPIRIEGSKSPSPQPRPKPKRLKKEKKEEGIRGPLTGSNFVFTGIMEGASREEYEDRVKACGGKVTTAVSTRTAYLVYGEVLEDGRRFNEGKKYLKAKEVKTKILSQAEFEEMMRTFETGKRQDEEEKAEIEAELLIKSQNSRPVTVRYSPLRTDSSLTDLGTLWTEKYAPKTLKDIAGNSGAIEKLIDWLKDWEAVILHGEKKDIIVRGGRFDPSRNLNARAALLSGPPGIGKTSAARLVARMLGYRAIELNASDTRSKAALAPIRDSSKNVALTDTGELVKTLVIMDEVDGMSAGDRGGVGAVTELIREARVPVICICNDHNSQKLKSLVSVCLDLRFARPTKQQIANRLLAIAAAEGLHIEPNALDRLVESSGNDIRQVLTMMEMIARTRSTLTYMDVKRTEVSFQKDQCVMIGNFEAAGMLLRGREVAKRKIRENLDLFFIDYQLIPLLIHENYLSTVSLDEMSHVSDSIAFGDVLEKHIRTDNEWSLLPMFGVASCVEPGCRATQGVGYPRFPEWFGKSSSQRKNERLLREVRSAMAGYISADTEDVLSDYIPVLYRLLLQPLQTLGKDGVDEVLDLMATYNLTPDMLKEHFIDLQLDSDRCGQELKDLPSTVKATLTKVFNACNAGGPGKRPKRAAAVDNSDAKFDPDVEEPPALMSSDTEEDDNSEQATPKPSQTRNQKSASRKKK